MRTSYGVKRVVEPETAPIWIRILHTSPLYHNMTVDAKNGNCGEDVQAALEPSRHRKPIGETEYPGRTLEGGSMNGTRSDRRSGPVDRFTSIAVVGHRGSANARLRTGPGTRQCATPFTFSARMREFGIARVREVSGSTSEQCAGTGRSSRKAHQGGEGTPNRRL